VNFHLGSRRERLMKSKTHFFTENPDDLIKVPRWFVESLINMVYSIPDWYNMECFDGVHDE
jgi:hypothetical protein